jgi:hypothetical protein
VLIEKIAELVICLDLIALLFSGVYLGSGLIMHDRQGCCSRETERVACRRATSL